MLAKSFLYFNEHGIRLNKWDTLETWGDLVLCILLYARTRFQHRKKSVLYIRMYVIAQRSPNTSNCANVCKYIQFAGEILAVINIIMICKYFHE